RLAEGWGDDPVAHLGVHPGELDAGLPSREETVMVRLDRVPRAGSVAGEDRRDDRLERLAIASRDAGGDLQELVDRGDVPQRRIDRVELELLATIGKSVRQHPVRDDCGPLEEDRTGVVEAACREAEAGERDERGTPPV